VDEQEKESKIYKLQFNLNRLVMKKSYGNLKLSLLSSFFIAICFSLS